MMQIKETEMKLKAQFPADDVEFRITKVDKTLRKALIKPVISSQAVMDRLDDIFSIAGWKISYTVSDNSVTCKLLIKFGEVWIAKEGLALFTVSFNDHSSTAFGNAAAKFGMGRDLMCQPMVWVELSEKRPEKPKRKLHFVEAQEFAGWWEEPDLLQTDPIEKNVLTESPTTSDSDFRKLSLPQKLEQLLALGIITEKKHVGYCTKIEDKTSGPGLLRYFEKQFDLLFNLHCLAINNKISIDLRATFYKRIMASKMNGFPDIEQEIKQLKEAA